MNDASDREIKLLAEQYRVRLGLRTWVAQADWADAVARSAGLPLQGRRSGRTSRGLLLAIARAVTDGIPVIEIDAKPAANMAECLVIARGLLGRLGLGLEIGAEPKVDGWRGTGIPFVEYIDHANTVRR